MTQEDLIAVNRSDSSLQLPNNELEIGHETWRYLSEEEDYFDSDVATYNLFQWCQGVLQGCDLNYSQEVYIQ